MNTAGDTDETREVPEGPAKQAGTSKRKRWGLKRKKQEEQVEFTHEGPDSRVDLLDYRWMEIVSNKWAAPGETLQLVVSLLIITLFCVGSLLLLRVLVYGWRGLEALFP